MATTITVVGVLVVIRLHEVLKLFSFLTDVITLWLLVGDIIPGFRAMLDF